MRQLALIIVAALCVAGCGARYGEMGFMGGVEQQRLADDLYLITGRGNAFTDRRDAYNFVLLRAAEIGRRSGMRYFVFANAADLSKRERVRTPGTYDGTTTAT